MGKYFVLLFLITNLINSAYSQKDEITAAEYNSETIPDSLKINANSVIRYSNKEIVVKSAGKAVMREHQIQTILNEKDESEAVFRLNYDRKFSDVNSAEMRVYDAKGVLIKKYKKSDFYDRSAVDGISIITDSRIMIVGHTIASYPITIEKIQEITLNSFLDLYDWHIQDEEVSIQQAKCKVSVKPAVGFRYQLKNFNQTPNKSIEGDYETYSWEVKNLKAIKPEEESQPWSFLPRISFATNLIDFDDLPGDMSTWQGFGKWQQTLNKNVTELPAKRVEEIKQMVSGISTDKEKAKFLYEYLQKNTRYVSIQLGIGGLKPFPAAFVDEKKYGDCKALSNYMHTLLKCVNIPSYYAIVRAGANEEPADPKFVNDPFNHVILCIPFKNDTTWLECTSTTKPFGKLGEFTENRNALVITEDGGKLINTPKSSLNDHTFISETHVTIESDGTAKAKLSIKSTGGYRDMLIGASEQKTDEQKRFLINYLNLRQPDIFELSQVSDKDGTKELELNLEYVKLSDVAAGGKYFYKPRLFDIWRSTLPPLDKRKTDYYFEHPMQKKNITTYVLPADVEVESIPADVSHKFNHGTYHVKYHYDKEKNEVKSETVLIINNHVIPAANYTEMQRFMDEIAKSNSKKMIIKKKA
ncbi:MAG: DUF3857 domain-containing protein [Sphingobacteriaceae bacterium]